MIGRMIVLLVVLMHGVRPDLHGQSAVEERRLEARMEGLAQGEEGLDDAVAAEDLQLPDGHRLRINRMGREALIAELGLTPEEAEAMLAYRVRFGAFIDPMELQAVPGWSLDLVRRILPMVRLDTTVRVAPTMAERFQERTQQVVLRMGSTLERARGYRRAANGSTPYMGDPLKVLLQYRMRYRQSLDAGFRLEKDAGEGWLTGHGLPDQVSGHLVVRDLGWIDELLIGDHEVTLGQGLVQWQGLAFRKGAQTMEVMRGGRVFKPHAGSDENRFHRGIAVSTHRRAIRANFFVGMDRLDAHREFDSLAGRAFFTSLQTSGLHRTASEIRDRHALSDLAFGGRLGYASKRTEVWLNLAGHRFVGAFRRSEAPYARTAFEGSSALNLSVDHHVRAGPVHLYGEWAMDRHRQLALTEGVLCSPGSRLDLVLQARMFGVGYRSVMESAFAEGSRVNNEAGIYIGMEWRPVTGWKVNAYADRFRFPALRYGIDGPSEGMDAMVRVGWRPEKTMEVYGQCSWESHPRDVPGTDPLLPVAGVEDRFRVRLHLEQALDRFISLNFRAEYNACRMATGSQEKGFASFLDLDWRGLRQRSRVGMRVLFFDTDGYGSRVYAYEGRLPGQFAIPAHQGKGIQWSLRAVYRPWKGWEIAGFLRGEFMQGIDHQGSGNEVIPGGQKAEWSLQIRSSF